MEEDFPLRGVNAILSAIQHDETADLVDLIAGLYEAIAGTDEAILQDFNSFSDEDLLTGLAERARAVLEGHVEVAIEGDDKTVLLDAARLLRAIEEAALENTSYPQSDRGSDLEVEWCTADGRYYVIPRLAPLPNLPRRPFLRRALRRFRVIPTKVGRWAIRLHRSTIVERAAEEGDEKPIQQNFGAAFFPGLNVAIQESSTTEFLVSGVSGFNACSLIAGHLDEASLNRCVGVSWAELTVDDASLAFLQGEAARRALDGAHVCRFLVPGSWHREIEGKTYNISRVLDGFGETLFEVRKWAKFQLGERFEAIEPGNEIHILIGEQDLMLVAICKDFLHEAKEVPYKSLNVDIAMVPSMMGKEGEDLDTVPGHAATAQTMRVRYGTRTLVVAQPAFASDDPKHGVGRVLAFPAKPLHAPAGELVHGPWHLCVLDSS